MNTGKTQDNRETLENHPAQHTQLLIPLKYNFFFLAFTQSHAMNWQYMPSPVLSYFLTYFYTFQWSLPKYFDLT